MELVVSNGEGVNSFVYYHDGININVTSFSNILGVLNGEKLRADFIDGEQVMLELMPGNEDIIDSIIAVRYMPKIESLSYFDGIKLELSESTDLDDLARFLKTCPYKLKLSTNNISLDKVYKICHFECLNEPIIESSYNVNSAPMSEMKNALDIAMSLKNSLNDKNLSPLEKLMFLYDYLKTRVYSEDDVYENSASLTKVIDGESIVCLGYANIFAVVANMLGIETEVKGYKNTEKENSGHSTVISYVNDNKYNYHGVLEFDPTWDSKKNSEDNNFTLNYNWFGLSPVLAEECKKGVHLEPFDNHVHGHKLGQNFENCFISFETLGAGIINKRQTSRLLEKSLIEFEKVGYEPGIELVNELLKKDVVDEDDILALQETYMEIFLNNLGYDEFLRLLYFVRRSEFVFGDEKYELDFDDVVNCARKRETRDNFMAYILFHGRNEYLNVTRLKEFKTIPKDVKNKVNYDQKRLELVKVLKQKKEQ